MTASTAPASATSLETKQRPWWVALIGGVFAFIVGAILLWSPVKTKVDTYMMLISLLGFYWLVTGILELVSMFTDHSAWGWKLFMGLVSIIAGSYILMYPVASGLFLPKIFVLILGLWALMQGIIMLVMAFKGAGWAAGILGVLGIMFGIALIGNYTAPGMGLAMIWTAAVAGVIGGILLIVQSFRMYSAS